MWVTDALGEPLVEQESEAFHSRAETLVVVWTRRIIEHARQQAVFFPDADPGPREEPPA